MTNEKMLEILKDFMKSNDFSKLAKLEQGLTENIRLEIEKSKGTKVKDLTIIKRIVAKGGINPKFLNYHPLTFKGKEYKCFLDGHYILASDNDFGYVQDSEPYDIGKFFESDNCIEKNENNVEYKVDMNDLKFFIKTHKRSERKPYIFEIKDGVKVGINAWFLKDGLDFCKTDTIYVTSTKTPIYVKSDDYSRIGFILPVNLNTINR